MNNGWKFRCIECSQSFEPSQARYVCPSCAKLQKPGYPTRGILRVVWETSALIAGWKRFVDRTVDRTADGANLRGIERVRGLLPLAPHTQPLSLIVGDTPLVAPQRLRNETGVARLWVKDDTRNPSASYKDRASALVCLKAVELGETRIVAASTGNAATALSCIAASVGQQALIVVPASAPRAKLVQMLCYGAELIPVRGSYDDAFELTLRMSEQLGWYNRNTAYNPFTIEGKKTSAFEIVHDLGDRAPDVVIVPTGDGVILSGVAKGFSDLKQAGVIAKVPRLIAVQASTSAAIAMAVQGNHAVEPVVNSHTVADSICVDAPRAGILAMQEIKASAGTAVMVSDEQIVQSIASLARGAGVFAEPAAAASLAGLQQALTQGLVERDEEVVLLVTGHGLKDVGAASKVVQIPEPVDPQSSTLVEVLKDKYSR